MKVTGIHIEDFQRFKYLDINLTYPEGHEKSGEPLEKVCIIGQSGTGKTRLLEVLGGLTSNYQVFKERYNFKNENGYISIKEKNFTLKKGMDDSKTYVYKAFDQKINNADVKLDLFRSEWNKLNIGKPELIFFPAELLYNIYEEAVVDDLSLKTIFDFSVEDLSLVWKAVSKQVEQYHTDELLLRQDISKVVEDNRNDLKSINLALKRFETWQQNTFNPIADVAKNCLDPILEKFYLRVKTKFDFQKKEDIGFIKIEDLKGNEIPYDLWSTGTKHIILSTLPLYFLKPTNTIILFDQPENSLYPDMQKGIVEYYSKLTQDCQLFFSTHSPIIASSFEPWEIIELKFNKYGHVYQELYYDGERHVDNYTITPNYLTYDLILSKVFDLKETYAPVRDEKITEVLMLRNQLEKLKKEDKLSTPAGKKLYDRYMKLAQKLSWEFELPQYEEA